MMRQVTMVAKAPASIFHLKTLNLKDRNFLKVLVPEVELAEGVSTTLTEQAR